MKLSEEKKKQLEDLYQSFLNNKKILKMKEIPLHRGSNCYEHCFKVAKKSMRRAISSHKKNLNYDAILVGAILHDYYLYDWRIDHKKRKRHGRNHPYIAASNSQRDFAISDEVKKIIESHMWPINMKEFPQSKEAKIVSICDKMVSLCESLTFIRYKQRKRDKYLKYISHLF